MKTRNILIVGGGIGGMAAAIALGRAGHRIDLIDIDPEWRVYGAGITITGPTLRAYKRLGLIDEIAAKGAITGGALIYRYDGTFLHSLDEPPIEEGLPATGGIMRPVLHEIMQEHVHAQDVDARLGITVNGLTQDSDGVDVSFSDGTTGRYDAVIGADGIASAVRSISFPGADAPRQTGQACWRISTRRPEGFARNEFYLGHRNPAGINACSEHDIYMWLLTPHEPGMWVEEDEAHDRLRAEIAEFDGTVGWIRDNMSGDDWINYRPLSAILHPAPWTTGQVALLGDAAHATTPHLASGAGMAIEDALVLAEELGKAGRSVAEALLAYSERRYPRCADVVETSIAVGEMQLQGGSAEAVAQRISGALHRLSEDF